MITLRRKVIARRKRQIFTLDGFPLHTGPRDNTQSLRREDFDGDDGS